MQNKLITLTAAAAMAGMATAAGNSYKVVYETTTSTKSICPDHAATALSEPITTSTIVYTVTVPAGDCGPTSSASNPVVTETTTITTSREASASSKFSSNEVGPTTGDVIGASSSQLDSTVHMTSTINAASTVTIGADSTTETKAPVATPYAPFPPYSAPGNSSSIIGTGTGTGAIPSGTGAFPLPSGVETFPGGAAAIGMSSILALGAMAAGALFLF
ncbi:hypothetical protein CLAFUW4_12764 [Fulvia fulva]|uniref:Uncharacterized protein n=1 Tax=Passalora fulva TaxID=5499 RepID=A0A9Q8PK49_PASFU|nr:uncharacterized protein CLAFUR5_12630 [Fulvia fulva]KAK4611703.1 hypothetical protein CLAFUR4_12768 [Fulvia fulva]KAK4612900.1 hypothetical protein CLAFUR0_12774 [Fulvia fulva]UJO24006.1 hypothetical protein CLAFUR5_12630 [Fulvia fulva]WPV21540.1 hypothetical protein CLAFUW4_12764 [Fulvia fulva]WPV36577.1 hypothetical protein CLAFUW7_12771 [Fulvia fulva]